MRSLRVGLGPPGDPQGEGIRAAELGITLRGWSRPLTHNFSVLPLACSFTPVALVERPLYSDPLGIAEAHGYGEEKRRSRYGSREQTTYASASGTQFHYECTVCSTDVIGVR
jgi:hypothetical protein